MTVKKYHLKKFVNIIFTVYKYNFYLILIFRPKSHKIILIKIYLLLNQKLRNKKNKVLIENLLQP